MSASSDLSGFTSLCGFAVAERGRDVIRFSAMRYTVFLGILMLAGCAVEPADDGSIGTVPIISPSIPHAPKLDGYRPLKSQGVEFRKYREYPSV